MNIFFLNILKSISEKISIAGNRILIEGLVAKFMTLLYDLIIIFLPSPFAYFLTKHLFNPQQTFHLALPQIGRIHSAFSPYKPVRSIKLMESINQSSLLGYAIQTVRPSCHCQNFAVSNRRIICKIALLKLKPFWLEWGVVTVRLFF